MISSVRIYFEVIKTSLAARMAYRGDFLISSLMLFVTELAAPMITILIYGTGASFPGWSLYEVILLQSIFMISRGIAFPFFFGMVNATLGRVNNGTFDLLLLKPKSALFTVVTSSFDCDSLGQLFGGLLLFLLSLRNLGCPAISQWIKFFILMVVSLIILFSFALLMSGIVIKWVGMGRVYEIFNSVTAFAQYPRSIFNKTFQIIITLIVPVAAIAFFPASALLGKPADGAAAACIMSIIFLILSLIFWHKMLGKYTSAGG